VLTGQLPGCQCLTWTKLSKLANSTPTQANVLDNGKTLGSLKTEYDGMTKLLETTEVPVTKGQALDIKIAIAGWGGLLLGALGGRWLAQPCRSAACCRGAVC
jgi:hypothetical protein